MSDQTAVPPRVSYGEIARVFIRLSLTAFGGPAAHIAIAEDELVTRRKWITREHYLDLVAATNLIPGPNSTETMIHVGHTLRGIPGAVVSGACFIVPAFLITLVLAVLYVSTGTIPQVDAALRGIMPVVVAIIVVAAYRLAPAALKSPALWLLFALSLAGIALLDLPEVVVMLGAGGLYVVYELARTRANGGATFALVALLGWQPAIQAVEAFNRASVGDIFFYFLRIGSVLFGSGYVLVSYIQGDLVDAYGWLSNRELLDSIAIGQITPGPVLTTSTVVGYILAGFPGAFAATLGIFLPSFVFVILTAPLIPKMRRSRIMGAFLSGINAGVIAALVYTLLALGREALTFESGGVSLIAVALLVLSLVAMLRFRVNTTWLMLVGAFVGVLAGAAALL